MKQHFHWMLCQFDINKSCHPLQNSNRQCPQWDIRFLHSLLDSSEKNIKKNIPDFIPKGKLSWRNVLFIDCLLYVQNNFRLIVVTALPWSVWSLDFHLEMTSDELWFEDTRCNAKSNWLSIVSRALQLPGIDILAEMSLTFDRERACRSSMDMRRDPWCQDPTLGGKGVWTLVCVFGTHKTLQSQIRMRYHSKPDLQRRLRWWLNNCQSFSRDAKQFLLLQKLLRQRNFISDGKLSWFAFSISFTVASAI